jgi:hypothetical protein
MEFSFSVEAIREDLAFRMLVASEFSLIAAPQVPVANEAKEYSSSSGDDENSSRGGTAAGVFVDACCCLRLRGGRGVFPSGTVVGSEAEAMAVCLIIDRYLLK